MLTSALALAALCYVPGDGIKSVELTITPLSCHVLFIDEGTKYDVFGYGQVGLAMYHEARLMVQDADPIPGSMTPLQKCAREAKDTCGAAGVKFVMVSDMSCHFGCYPPSVAPTPPVTPPVTPPATGVTP
jgi:hypothetical protein